MYRVALVLVYHLDEPWLVCAIGTGCAVDEPVCVGNVVLLDDRLQPDHSLECDGVLDGAGDGHADPDGG